jgi:hypothetical protein
MSEKSCSTEEKQHGGASRQRLLPIDHHHQNPSPVQAPMTVVVNVTQPLLDGELSGACHHTHAQVCDRRSDSARSASRTGRRIPSRLWRLCPGGVLQEGIWATKQSLLLGSTEKSSRDCALLVTAAQHLVTATESGREKKLNDIRSQRDMAATFIHQHSPYLLYRQEMRTVCSHMNSK